MNILVLTNQLTMGGAEQFVVRVANELQARGHRPVVASAGGPLAGLLAPGIREAIVPGMAKQPLEFARLIRDLADLLSREAIHLVHANSPTTALAARIARVGRPIPVVASGHGVWTEKAKPGVARLFNMGADRVVGCSEALTRDLVSHGLSARKAMTIHNGIPLPGRAPAPDARQAVRSALGIGPGAPVVLSAARLTDQKGLCYLLDAMPRVLSVHSGAVLLLAGDGDRRQDLEAQAATLALGRSVRFLGNRGDVPDLMRAADVYCLPSIDEGLPLALAEAMAAGLPVVATPVGGVPEIVLHGETGWLVPPREPGALALRIGDLLDSPTLRAEMSRAGRAQVAAEFTLDRMVSRFEALYDEEVTAALGLRLIRPVAA